MEPRPFVFIALVSVSAARGALLKKRVRTPQMDAVLAASPFADCVVLVGANEG